MKKNITSKGMAKRKQQARKQKHEELTIGIDLGDRTSPYCILDEGGEVLVEGSVKTARASLRECFGRLQRSRIAIEAGTHSAWVERVLGECGHEVIVANARAIPLLTANSGKSDPIDAEMLARMARVDPKLLRPIRHRGEEAHGHLIMIRGRRILVEARTKLMNAARGLSAPGGGPGPCRASGDRAAAGGGGSDELGDPESGRKDRGHRAGALRGRSTASDASEGSGNTGGADVRTDAGRPSALPQEPGGGLLHRSAAQAKPIGRKQSATGDYQRRRPVPAHAAGQ